MRVVERSFTELLSRPGDVVEGLDDHDVVLHRRNGPPLRLTDAVRDAERFEASELLARLLRLELLRSDGGWAQMVDDAFPWATFLPMADRHAFVDQLASTLMTIFDVEDYSSIGRFLREWHSAAEIHADPRLAQRLRSSIEVHVIAGGNDAAT